MYETLRRVVVGHRDREVGITGEAWLSPSRNGKPSHDGELVPRIGYS